MMLSLLRPELRRKKSTLYESRYEASRYVKEPKKEGMYEKSLIVRGT